MKNTPKRVLVAYGSRAGSTAEVAARVAEVLNKNGLAAEAVRANQARDVAAYDAFVLGSAVRAGKLMPEALKFLGKNKATVAARPFAAFVVCLAMKDRDDKGRATAGAYLDPIRQQVKPLSEGLFAGVYNPDKVDFVMRTITNKMIKAPAGDFRNWDEVEAWAKDLVPLFTARPA